MTIKRFYRTPGGIKQYNIPDLVEAQRGPNTGDRYAIGTIWTDLSTGNLYALSRYASSDPVWVTLGASPGEIATLTGDSGVATPNAGNINILGTALQIDTIGASDDITLSFPTAMTVPGSLLATTTLAATTTVTAGTNVVATAGSVSAATTVTAGTNLIATAGSVAAATTVTAGTDLVSTAGNVLISGAAKQLRVHGGAATDFVGTVTLSAGSSGAIANTNIAATDRIIPFRIDINSSTAIGVGFSYTISAGASFTILSLDAAAATETDDNSIIGYFIYRQT